MAGASRLLAVFRNPVQRYNKKNEQRKFATRLLLLLLDCYCNATGMLLVIVFPEAVVLERKCKDFIQFVIHDTGVIVWVYIALFLPLAHFFGQRTCLVIPAGQGALQRLDDRRNLIFLLGFTGKKA